MRSPVSPPQSLQINFGTSLLTNQLQTLSTKSMNFSKNGLRVRTPFVSRRITQFSSSYSVIEISRVTSPFQQVIPNLYNIHTSGNYPEAVDNKCSETCGTLIGKSANQFTYPKIKQNSPYNMRRRHRQTYSSALSLTPPLDRFRWLTSLPGQNHQL